MAYCHFMIVLVDGSQNVNPNFPDCYFYPNIRDIFGDLISSCDIAWNIYRGNTDSTLWPDKYFLKRCWKAVKIIDFLTLQQLSQIRLSENWMSKIQTCLESKLLCVHFSDTQGVWYPKKNCLKLGHIGQKFLKSRQKFLISNKFWRVVWQPNCLKTEFL